MFSVSLLLLVSFFQSQMIFAFHLPQRYKPSRCIDTTSTPLSLQAASLSLENMEKPLVPTPLSIKIKGKTLTPWGLLYAASILFYAIIVLPFMSIGAFLCDTFGDKKRRITLDWIVHFWANFAMSSVLFQPKVIGLEYLPPKNETVMYVPNHTSFMDILVLSGFVPRPFKYLSKIEIKNIPIIGLGMKLAKHVFLKRDDLQNAFECNEICTQRLLDGNSMVLFAEGTRSIDGRLKTFKKGAFQMAKKARVRIVPVSLGNLHRWMPPSALLPLAPMRNVIIQIHPPIDTAGKPVSEIRKLCFDAVNSGLPEYQKAVVVPPSSTETSQEDK